MPFLIQAEGDFQLVWATVVSLIKFKKIENIGTWNFHHLSFEINEKNSRKHYLKNLKEKKFQKNIPHIKI